VKAQRGNIYRGAGPTAGEGFHELFSNSSVKIERIVSRSHSSPPGFWYDQNQDEWVIVLKGRAVLEFDGGETMVVAEGDYVTIPRHLRHRVAETSEETLWVAVHAKADEKA
jgi:cupin 2 domain-containing protein